MTDDRIVLDALTAGYGDAPAIRDINIRSGAGEVVGLLGSNGAGKTTTLRAISGITARVISGKIVLEGQDMAEMSPTARARAGIAHVPEGRGLFFGLTVGEHFRLAGYKGERIDEELAYEHFPALKPLRGRRAGLLSGGEQQMLAIGRALARRPQVLLLDELSLGLAPLIVERILKVIRQYARDSRCAVLLVEQHVHLALDVIDRGYVLAHGEISIDDTAAKLREDSQLIASSYLGDESELARSEPDDVLRAADVQRG